MSVSRPVPTIRYAIRTPFPASRWPSFTGGRAASTGVGSAVRALQPATAVASRSIDQLPSGRSMASLPVALDVLIHEDHVAIRIGEHEVGGPGGLLVGL